MKHKMTRHISGITALFLFLFISFSLISPPVVSGQEKESRRTAKSKKKKDNGTAIVGNTSLLIDAKRLEFTGNIKDAEDGYRKYVDRYPDDPNGHFELARLLA